MRLQMAGAGAPPLPNPSIFTANGNLDKTYFVEQGFTHFDVIAIGGGGGHGFDYSAPRGAGGGGGGYHRKQGLLSALPTISAVVVGANGAPGASTLNASGGSGGASTFNGTTVMASGGDGGRSAYYDGETYSGGYYGGKGGLGNTTLPGVSAGSSQGGDAAYESGPADGTNGTLVVTGSAAAGTLVAIGRGGGGARSTGQFASTTGNGGAGSVGDTNVQGAGAGTSNGSGGGATAFALTGSLTQYGRADISSGGIVVFKAFKP